MQRKNANGYEVAPVKRLEIGRKLAGYGGYGWVYRGRLHEGNSVTEVAIKRFRPQTKLTEERVAHYQKAIAKLREWGADVPRVGFHRINGEWVQVMELFNKIHGYDRADLKDEKTRGKLLKQMAATANAGYHPNGDAIGVVSTLRGPRFVIYDLDAFAECARLKSNPHEHRASFVQAITTVAKCAEMKPHEVAAELKGKISRLPAIDVVREIERKLKGN